jgi:hypothetical protein
MKWVGILVERVTKPAVVKAVGDFSGVYALFIKASEHLKYPKITLQTEIGDTIQLSLSGARSRLPDTVNVTDGSKFGTEGLWYGRVFSDGKWQQSGRADAGKQAGAEKVLKRLAKDPEGVAAEYGKLTGSCCFCLRKLDDERSTSVGYGPVCAKNFSLNWGVKPPAPPVAKVGPSRRVRVRVEVK